MYSRPSYTKRAVAVAQQPAGSDFDSRAGNGGSRRTAPKTEADRVQINGAVGPFCDKNRAPDPIEDPGTDRANGAPIERDPRPAHQDNESLHKGNASERGEKLGLWLTGVHTKIDQRPPQQPGFAIVTNFQEPLPQWIRIISRHPDHASRVFSVSNRPVDTSRTVKH